MSKVIYGKYARQRADKKWEMTEEGQAFLVEWLKEWPLPAKLFCKAYGRTYAAWMAANRKQGKKGARTEAINQTCLVAICRAILTYDGRVKFSTYAANAMFFEARKELDEINRLEGRKYDARIVSGDARHGADEVSVFDAVADPRRGSVDCVDGDDHWLAMIDVAAEPHSTMLPAEQTEAGAERIRKRWRHVFVSHFGEGESQAKLAKDLKVTRSFVANIVERGCHKIRETMFADA
jgi:DNA-directed RNA polymerase specialized sigma24 family protein